MDNTLTPLDSASERYFKPKLDSKLFSQQEMQLMRVAFTDGWNSALDHALSIMGAQLKPEQTHAQPNH